MDDPVPSFKKKKKLRNCLYFGLKVLLSLFDGAKVAFSFS